MRLFDQEIDKYVCHNKIFCSIFQWKHCSDYKYLYKWLLFMEYLAYYIFLQSLSKKSSSLFHTLIRLSTFRLATTKSVPFFTFH